MLQKLKGLQTPQSQTETMEAQKVQELIVKLKAMIQDLPNTILIKLIMLTPREAIQNLLLALAVAGGGTAVYNNPRAVLSLMASHSESLLVATLVSTESAEASEDTPDNIKTHVERVLQSNYNKQHIDTSITRGNSLNNTALQLTTIGLNTLNRAADSASNTIAKLETAERELEHSKRELTRPLASLKKQYVSTHHDYIQSIYRKHLNTINSALERLQAKILKIEGNLDRMETELLRRDSVSKQRSSRGSASIGGGSTGGCPSKRGFTISPLPACKIGKKNK